MSTRLRDGFDQPIPVTDVQVAFPAEVADLMPPMSDIPDDFRDWMGRGEARQWVKFQSDWFFGSPVDLDGLTPREGVDKTAALRHLAVIQGSFEPSHEHKQAAVAWLASRWFTGVTG